MNTRPILSFPSTRRLFAPACHASLQRRSSTEAGVRRRQERSGGGSQPPPFHVSGFTFHASVLYFIFAFLMANCWAADKAGHMQLTSTAFSEGAPIPARHACDADNVSPLLKWSGVPAEAKSLVLIADYPDAPVW